MSDWGSDVCSSDLLNPRLDAGGKRSHRRPAKRALAEELGIFTGQEAKVFEQWLRHFGVPAEVARSAEEHVFHQIGSARHESIVGSGQRFHDRLKVITGFIDKCVDLLEALHHLFGCLAESRPHAVSDALNRGRYRSEEPT